MNSKALRYFIIGTFVTLYVIVSVISTIHVIDFFKLSNPDWLAISLAIAFEIGAAASLAALIALDKMNKGLIWSLFIILTAMQMMGNTYYAFTHLQNYQGWIDLFGLQEEEPLYQKRILSIISGAILPLVALGFIKSLVDYIRPDKDKDAKRNTDKLSDWDVTLNDGLNDSDNFNLAASTSFPISASSRNKQKPKENPKEAIEETATPELTKKDIETYQEKTKTTVEEPKNSPVAAVNPQIAPGLNM